MLLAACGQRERGSEQAPQADGDSSPALISDQAHDGGTSGFFFLPPTVLQLPPPFTGLFDASATPIARVCAGTGACSDATALAVFTRTSGTGGGPLAKVNVSTTLQAYTAVWDTTKCAAGRCALVPGAPYRLHVSVVNSARTEVELGYADLQVLAKATFQSVNVAQYSPLVKGLPYVIAFRIEKCATAACPAADQCHAAASCVPSTGQCSPPVAKADGTPCDDGNACTLIDTCQAGRCVGSTPVVCTAADTCHDAGTCEPATGLCSSPAKPDGAPCDDGNACTSFDTCQAGTCVGSTPVVCAATDQCHDAGTCEPSTGLCSSPAKPDGTSCDDGNACTLVDTCRAGSCVGSSPVVCAAADQCHGAGICEPTTGLCSSPAKPDGTPCNDGNACTSADSCRAGSCVGSSPVACVAIDACHDAGVCDPATGICSNPPKPSCGPGQTLPPDPAAVAPPLPSTTPSSLFASTQFLYSGPSPIQTGVAPGTIELRRAAVVRGKVTDTGGASLPGATITVLGHPELGQTLSRADGMFDLAVNGGGSLTIVYQKAGFPTAQRTLPVPWQDFTVAPDVALVPYDANANPVTLGSSLQLARASSITDQDGTRQATLLFPRGTVATMSLAGGGSAPLLSFHVRLTEYTVGPSGPNAMPADLPPTSGYTYEVEYSIDEAEAVGATQVTFSPALVSYTENFLGFPVGGVVPSGDYDRRTGMWMPLPNGVVVQVLAVAGGQASLDVDGSGLPASDAVLAALGVGSDELQALAALYAPGQSLWRVPIDRFLGLQ
jgi:hypothetical protein